MSLPTTQRSIIIQGKRQPLGEATSPVHPPESGEVVIKVAWTASTPLDLHRADGGLLVDAYPSLTGGGGAAGSVVAVGSGDIKGLVVGDRVAAFAFRGGKEANHQEFITVPAFLVSKVPRDMSLVSAVTVNVNLVTVFHTAKADLDIALPWPKPDHWTPDNADRPILIWGASSSVGIYAVQVFRHWGYKNLVAVSSGRHHAYLTDLGATTCFDYTAPDVVSKIKAHLGDAVPQILDCIGSVHGTLEPLSQIAPSGSRVAVMLPVIVRDATDDVEPLYEMDAANCLQGKWASGVEVRGVRTHFYLQDEDYKQKLQPEVVPALLAEGVIQPNNYREVQGDTLLARAQAALDLLRARAVSGERLVWRVAE